MSTKFTRFSETVDVDHNESESSSNGNSTGDPAGPKPPNLQQPFIYLCQTKCRFVIGVVIILLIIVSFVAIVSFIVKCDEDKLLASFESRRTAFEKAIFAWAEHNPKENRNIEEEYKSQEIRWVPGSQFDEYSMEPAGNELYQKGSLLMYVARASLLGGIVVGKYSPRLNNMYIGYNGKEPVKAEFELLTFPRGTLSWIYTNVTTLPSHEDNLVNGGAAPVSGESTYICRGMSQGHLIIGKFLTSNGKCLVAYKNKEFGLENFEILTVNEMGRIIGVDA